ncbi:MAG: hypothetical protein Q4G66_10195 [bacterium]|nr:hypothetical protein [bacterium]
MRGGSGPPPTLPCGKTITWQAAAVAICLGLALQATPAPAGNVTYQTRLRATQVYDDNLFLVDEHPDLKDEEPAEEEKTDEQTVEAGDTQGEEQDVEELDRVQEPVEKKMADWVTTISPELELGYETERLKSAGTVRFDLIRHGQHSELNDVEQFYKQTIAYELSPYSKIGADAAYSRESSRERELEETGLLLGNTVRTQQDYRGWVQHNLSEYSLLDFSYNYSTEDFSSSSLDDLLDRLDAEKAEQEALEKEENESATDAAANEEESEKEPSPAELRRQRREAVDTKTHWASLGITREVDWLRSGSYVYLSSNYLHQESELSIQDSASVALGLGLQLSETLSFSFDAGLNYGRDSYDNRQLRLLAEAPYYELEVVPQTDSQWGPIAHAQLKYAGEDTTIFLNAAYDVRPASGTGTLTDRTTAQLRAENRLCEKIRVYSYATYYHNKQDGIMELPPAAAEEALAFHNSVAALKDRLERELEKFYEVDKTTYSLGLGFLYDLSSLFSLKGEYVYRIHQDDVKGSDARGNRFLLQLSMKFPVK